MSLDLLLLYMLKATADDHDFITVSERFIVYVAVMVGTGDTWYTFSLYNTCSLHKNEFNDNINVTTYHKEISSDYNIILLSVPHSDGT